MAHGICGRTQGFPSNTGKIEKYRALRSTLAMLDRRVGALVEKVRAQGDNCWNNPLWEADRRCIEELRALRSDLLVAYAGKTR